MPIDLIAQAAFADASGSVSVPYSFNSWALNRYLVVFCHTCHPTGGLSSEPVDGPLVYAGVNLHRRRGDSGTVEGGAVPPRSMMFTGPNFPEPWASPPLSGNVVVTLNATTHITVHVVGFRGAVNAGFWDTDQGGGTSGTASLNVTYDDFYAGVMGVALKEETGTTQTAGAGISGLLAPILLAGTGATAVRGSVWASLEAANWTVNGGAIAWAATGLQFKGGADGGAAPPSAPRDPLGEYVKHELFWRGAAPGDPC